MIEKSKASHVLGIELAKGFLRGAKLSLKKTIPVLDELFTIQLPKDTSDVKPLYIEKTKQSLELAAKNNLITTTLPAADSLTRSLSISLKKTKEIDSVLKFQAEPLLPYSIEEAVLDKIVVSQTQDGTQLTLQSTQKSNVERLINEWIPKKITPEVITSTPAALANFCGLVAKDLANVFVVHISKTETVCVLVQNGSLIASQNCNHHLGELESALKEDNSSVQTAEDEKKLKDISWDSLSEQETPKLKQAIEQLKQDLARTLFAMEKQTKITSNSDILLTGDCGELFDLIFHLGHFLNKKVVTPDVPVGFKAPLPQMLKFAIPIGAALGSLTETKNSINFRQGALAYPDPWKRLKKPFIAYFGVSLLTSAALYLLGETYLGKEEDSVREEYTQLLTAAQKPHSEFEKQLDPQLTTTYFLKDISMDQLKDRVETLERELKTAPDVFPLYPNILTVSDVLAWLNTQPSVVTKNAETNSIQPLIRIDSFSYAMVKRPEISKKNERYQVKIEVEFTTPTPKEAREFHDVLIAPNSIVDPKQEVRWSTNRGKYKASFYLKDKTVYHN